MIKSITILLLAILTLPACSFFYVLKQGVYQIKLVTEAEPIEMTLRRPNLLFSDRKKLELIIKVRTFAENKLGLDTNKNYKNVNLEWQNIIHNVSAAKPLAFEPYYWWFPIIGHVPYKGFFDEEDALNEQTSLQKQGYETLKYKVGGYSTLGYFADPVWPSMLKLSDIDLVELIIHELSHARVYINNQSNFNESLANFIAEIGAREYFIATYGKDSPEIKELIKYHADLELYRKFFYELYLELDNLYKKADDESMKIKEKNVILNKAKIEYYKLNIDEQYKLMDWSKVNNAYLLSFKRYNQDTEIFKELYLLLKEDLSLFVSEVAYYAQSRDPFGDLAALVHCLKASTSCK